MAWPDLVLMYISRFAQLSIVWGACWPCGAGMWNHGAPEYTRWELVRDKQSEILLDPEKYSGYIAYYLKNLWTKSYRKKHRRWEVTYRRRHTKKTNNLKHLWLWKLKPPYQLFARPGLVLVSNHLGIIAITQWGGWWGVGGWSATRTRQTEEVCET